MILAIVEVMPFTIVVSKLPLLVAVLEFIIVEVPIEPATFEIKVFMDEFKVFEASKFVTAKFVTVAFCKFEFIADKLFILVVDAFRFCVFVVVAVIESKIGLLVKE
jgi:hypothetical protein